MSDVSEQGDFSKADLPSNDYGATGTLKSLRAKRRRLRNISGLKR
jgi:hypothetical protein